VTAFDPDDGLDDLTAEELEEQAFGPDPDRKRRKRTRRRRKQKVRQFLKRPAPRASPPAEPLPVPSAPAAVTTKFCYACGAELDLRAEICPHCGVGQPMGPFVRGRRTRGEKSKGGATLLALTLGGIGAHRFYLGQPKVGIAMLLLSWTFLPVLVGWVDFVRYAFMTDRDFAARYGRPAPPMLNPPRPIRRLEAGPPRLAVPAEEAGESAEAGDGETGS
jgi:TM2 domain-containing membrane protein YozV